MKTVASTPSRKVREHTQGILLMECLVYIAIFFVILGVAFAVFYRCYDSYVGLRRNAEDITVALKAGERWREDVRCATGPVICDRAEAGPVLRIPQSDSEVLYLFADSSVSRLSAPNRPPEILLERVESSVMEIEPRTHVISCRWNVELKPHRKGPRIVPRFSFLSVPQTSEGP